MGAVCPLAIIALAPKPLDPNDLRSIAHDPKVDDIPLLIRALKSDLTVGRARTLLVQIGPPAVPELTKSLAMWSRDGREKNGMVSCRERWTL